MSEHLGNYYRGDLARAIAAELQSAGSPGRIAVSVSAWTPQLSTAWYLTADRSTRSSLRCLI